MACQWYRAHVVSPRDKLLILERLLDEDRPPPRELYVKTPAAVVDDVVREVEIDPTANKKHLLFAARGGGKSAQLHEIFRHLGAFTRVDIDLDRMGIGVGSMTAFDLLYVIAVGALARLAPGKPRDELFKRLARAYGGSEEQTALGEAKDAVDGLVGFGGTVGTLAGVIGMATAPVSMATAGLAVLGAGLRLRSRSVGVVPAASQQGRELQEAARSIFRAVRDTPQAPIVALIDGLEKVNGQAAQWFRNTFENTRLLVDAEVTMIIASPPCPFSDTNAATQFGYVTHVLYGFGTEDLEPLTSILARRVEAAELDATSPGFAAAIRACAIDSGGHPRHAVFMLKRIVQRAAKDGTATLTDAHVAGGREELRRALALGLTETELRALLRVNLMNQLPNNDVGARLFGDGQILADPPGPSGMPRFRAHPLLDKALVEYRDKLAALAAAGIGSE